MTHRITTVLDISTEADSITQSAENALNFQIKIYKVNIKIK